MICPYIDKKKTQQNTKTLIEDLRSVIKSGFYEVKKLNIAEVEKNLWFDYSCWNKSSK